MNHAMLSQDVVSHHYSSLLLNERNIYNITIQEPRSNIHNKWTSIYKQSDVIEDVYVCHWKNKRQVVICQIVETTTS